MIDREALKQIRKLEEAARKAREDGRDDSELWQRAAELRMKSGIIERPPVEDDDDE